MESELDKLRKLTKELTTNGYLTDQTNTWKFAFNAVNELVCVTNKYLELKFMNSAMSARLGIKNDFEYLNNKFTNFVELNAEYISKYQPSNTQPTLYDKCFISNLHGWFTVKRYCVRDDKNRHIGYTFLMDDITDELEAENKLKDINRTLIGVLDSIPDIITVQDTDHTILMKNSASNLLAVAPEFSSKCYGILGRTRHCEICQTKICKKLKKPTQLEQYIDELGGWYDCRSYPILNDEGEVEKIVEHLRDISDIKAQKQKLNKVYKELNDLVLQVDGYIWQKEFKPSISKTEFVNTFIDPTFCKDFYKLEGVTLSDIYYNKTSSELLNTLRNSGTKHTFGSVCKSTDLHCIEQGESCDYFEMGYIEDKWFILRTRKTPIFNQNNECVKILGFGNNCSGNAMMIKKYIERGIAKDLIKKLEHNTEETKSYWVVGKGLEDRRLNHTDFV